MSIVSSRRDFLKGAATAGLLFSTRGLLVAEAQTPSATRELFLPDEGWRMWPDTKAAWKEDTIYLPGEFSLSQLPVNPPTGGWAALSSSQGTSVTLPATVEQFYWGAFGHRPYKNEYKFEETDHEVKNGSYCGVSWWWREIEIPEDFKGRRIFLHVRAARLRAEVYLNQKLVGYSILEELPFECEITDAARPGERNQLAIRITNPGGEMDWVDGRELQWGDVRLQSSHGFGGLDRALRLTAHGDVRVKDSWVLNTPDARAITVHAELQNLSTQPAAGSIVFSVIDPASGHAVAKKDLPARVEANAAATFHADLRYDGAKLWDLDTPHLYHLRVEWEGPGASSDFQQIWFGFRWFAPEGIGTNAMFRLNGRRTRIYTSISWGFWGVNGIFPTPELAKREVEAAKTFHLNCLNFHRNVGKPEVFDLQDRMGLLRCMEPGGGYQAVSASGFAQRYMEAKIVHMIRAFRSHPSLVEYILQNEAKPDLKNPNLYRILRLMHQEDPSRSIVANDGFASRSAQAWMGPYSDRVRTSAEGGAGGWWDEHQGPFSDVWNDRYYNGPDDFLYRSTDQGEIVEWGEMKGAASPDNHALLIQQIEQHGGKSYDLEDHKEILAAYEKFLDKWGFRTAFPSASALFRSISRRAYESWGQFMENIRICDVNDYAAISGWESTAMENHSGLLDNMRDFKTDPQLLAKSLLPVRPVAKQYHLVLRKGERAKFDIYLLNDTGRPVMGKLVFSITGPEGKRTRLGTWACPEVEKDKLSYLVQKAVESDPLNGTGVWTTRLELNGSASSAHECRLWVVETAPYSLSGLKIGLIGAEQSLPFAGVTAEPYSASQKYDILLAMDAPQKSEPLVPTDDMGAYRQSGQVREDVLPEGVIEQVRNGTPLVVVTGKDSIASGFAKQLAGAGAFTFYGMVGASRASWMGSWYFVRRHPLYAGMPVDEGMSIHYQVKGAGSNGWLVDGPQVEVVAGYSRDHDRNIGAGTFTASLGQGRIVMQRIADMHPVFQERFLANALAYGMAR
ncbi:MAG TPA: glycoside hydrolase [Pseudacidobacterium sp.]|nr:glycoside hydrolase [Pseudacidobacterium sp.]